MESPPPGSDLHSTPPARADGSRDPDAPSSSGRLPEWLTRPRSFTFRFTVERLTWLALALGIFWRVGEYAGSRPLYLDEVSLGENFVGRPIFLLNTPLLNKQSAPPGFVVLQRLAGWSLGRSTFVPPPRGAVPDHAREGPAREGMEGSILALRLLPLLAGVASLFLMRDVARRWLDPWAVPVAVALAAVADELLYYSSEIKQYSTDVAVALCCFAMAARVGDAAGPPTWRRALGAAAVGAVAVWISIVSIFTLAGIGLVLTAAPLLRGDWRRALTFAGVGALWLLSFGGSFYVSKITLDTDPFIWIWWDFALYPFPPRTLAQAEQIFWVVLNVFVDPAGIATPLGPPGSAFLALALYALGAVALGRSRPGAVVMLVLPIVCALTASGLRVYPFHGRTILYLVPPVLLLVAQGVAVVRRVAGRGAAIGLVAFLLIQPVIDAFDHLVHYRSRGFDTHGDLRPDLLDYREAQEAQRRLRERIERIRRERQAAPGADAPRP